MTPARRRFGSIRQLASGRWQARYRDHAGRQHAAPTTFDSARAADRWLARIETDLERGSWADPRLGRIRFGDWCDEYLANAHHLRPTTRHRIAGSINVHLRPAFGHMALSAVTPLDVRRFVQHLTQTLAPGSVRTNYGTLRSIFAAAVDADLLAVTPCRGVSLPRKPKTDVVVVTPDELHRLAEAIDTRYQPMVYLAGVMGLRWGEVAGIRVGRVDVMRRRLLIAETAAQVGGFSEPKTDSSRRTLTVPPFLAAVLAEHLAAMGLTAADPDELVFTAPRGGRLHAATWHRDAWKAARATAGLPDLKFHHLRHSSVAMAIEAGAHPKQIQEMLGHSSIVTTFDTYGHVLERSDDAVAGRLDEMFTDRRDRPAR